MPELKPVETGPLPVPTTGRASPVGEAGTIRDLDYATQQNPPLEAHDLGRGRMSLSFWTFRNYLCLGEPVAYIGDLDLQAFASLGSRNEDDEPLNSGYSVAPLAHFGNRNVVLLAHLHRLLPKSEATTTVVSPSSKAQYVSTPLPRFSGSHMNVSVALTVNSSARGWLNSYLT